MSFDSRLKGALVVASISGGKDSAAMSLWLTEQGIEHRRVFADTGWEHESTYAYLRGPLAAKLGPIDEVQGRDAGMANLVRRKGMFPSRLRRFCTEQLKVRPLMSYVAALQDAGHDVVNAVGIRAGESTSRSKMPEWEWSDDFDCWVWRPLIGWTEQQVIDQHHKCELAPNPLYLKGATRVGCFPCIFARKAEVRLVADIAPERIAEIRALEAEVGDAAQARYAAKGETLASKGFTRPTFFHTHNHDGSTMTSIDDVVRWSKTARGGKQMLLLDDQPEGCVRWGLCEANSKDGDE